MEKPSNKITGVRIDCQLIGTRDYILRSGSCSDDKVLWNSVGGGSLRGVDDEECKGRQTYCMEFMEGKRLSREPVL